MTSDTPRYPFETQCEGKKKHKTKKKAIWWAHTTARKEKEKILTVYKCPHCGKYHVGGVKV